MEPPDREPSVMRAEVGFGLGVAIQPNVASPDVWRSWTGASALSTFDIGFAARDVWVRLSIEATPDGFEFCGDEKPLNNVEGCLGRYIAARLLPALQVGPVSVGPVAGYSLPYLEVGGQLRVDFWSLAHSGWTATWVVDGVGVSPDAETFGLLVETQLVFARRYGARADRPPPPRP